jgi:hypothetical protein
MGDFKKHQARKTPCMPVNAAAGPGVITEHKCVYCIKVFKSKYNLKNHGKTCKVKKDVEVLGLPGMTLQLKATVAANNVIINQLREEVKQLTDTSRVLRENIRRLNGTPFQLINGIVYFIKVKDSNRFKIGFTTKTIEKRLSGLQVGCPYDLIPYRAIKCSDPNKLEKYLHDCFSAQNIRGEWFDLTDDEVDQITNFIGGAESTI